MNNGICILAQNNNTTNYVEQAYALALSVLAHSPTTNISIITDDTVSTTYKNVFDQIIPIIGNDLAAHKDWKIDNRWKIFQLTPYEHTTVFDADMLVLDPIIKTSNNLAFTSTVKSYRNETVNSRFYRKTFDANDLPNIYTGFYQFNKSNESTAFFNLLELIMQNWEMFYKLYTPLDMQKWNSVDVSAAIALKILGVDYTSNLSFTHMKPQVQHLSNVPNKWTDILSVDFGNDTLYINGFKQSGVLHYVEDNFLTRDMLMWLEERV